MQRTMTDIYLEDKGLHDINPLRCGEEPCLPFHSFGPEVRSYYLLIYVVSGKGIYHTPAESYQLCKNQILVLYPHEATICVADGTDPWHYRWVGFESSIDIAKILNGAHVLTAPECSHIFQAFLNSTSHISKSQEYYICGRIFEMLSLLDKESEISQNRIHQYVRRAQNFIELNFQQELRVEMLANSLNLDRAYLSRIFKRYTGKSPQRFIVDFRLDKAAELLAQNGFTPGEVSRYVGYSDISNFSRMFNRRFGVSPSAYQKESKKIISS